MHNLLVMENVCMKSSSLLCSTRMKLKRRQKNTCVLRVSDQTNVPTTKDILLYFYALYSSLAGHYQFTIHTCWQIAFFSLQNTYMMFILQRLSLCFYDTFFLKNSLMMKIIMILIFAVGIVCRSTEWNDG